MNNRIDWFDDRIDLKKMGRKWTIANWCFIICGIILGGFNLVGSSVFHLPGVYVLSTGFVYMLAFFVYAFVLLLAYYRNKRRGINGDGTPIVEAHQFSSDGHASIDERKHETIFTKPAQREERWQYGVLYLGFASWLFKIDYDLFKVLFFGNHHPMTLMEYIIPVSTLILCTGVPIVLVVIGVKQFMKPASKEIL